MRETILGWLGFITCLILVFTMIFGMSRFFAWIDKDSIAKNNYTLVNYTANGDTLAIYENVKDYRFHQPSIILRFEDGKEIIVSGNYTLFDKSKR